MVHSEQVMKEWLCEVVNWMLHGLQLCCELLGWGNTTYRASKCAALRDHKTEALSQPHY